MQDLRVKHLLFGVRFFYLDFHPLFILWGIHPLRTMNACTERNENLTHSRSDISYWTEWLTNRSTLSPLKAWLMKSLYLRGTFYTVQQMIPPPLTHTKEMNSGLWKNKLMIWVCKEYVLKPALPRVSTSGAPAPWVWEQPDSVCVTLRCLFSRVWAEYEPVYLCLTCVCVYVYVCTSSLLSLPGRPLPWK